MSTLYEIGQGFLDLEEYLLNAGGDVSDAEIESQVVGRFAELNLSRDEKLDGYGMLMRNLAARGKARKEEAARLNNLGNADEKAEKRLKTHLLQLFEMFDWKEEVQTTRFKFSCVSNGGNLPIKVKEEFKEKAELLPEEFRAVTYAPNLEAIRQALQDGEKLDFAEFGTRGKSIRVK